MCVWKFQEKRIRCAFYSGVCDFILSFFVIGNTLRRVVQYCLFWLLKSIFPAAGSRALLITRLGNYLKLPYLTSYGAFRCRLGKKRHDTMIHRLDLLGTPLVYRVTFACVYLCICVHEYMCLHGYVYVCVNPPHAFFLQNEFRHSLHFFFIPNFRTQISTRHSPLKLEVVVELERKSRIRHNHMLPILKPQFD